jgi:hypothetical protein
LSAETGRRGVAPKLEMGKLFGAGVSRRRSEVERDEALFGRE